jgi:phosphate transport system permease protein
MAAEPLYLKSVVMRSLVESGAPLSDISQSVLFTEIRNVAAGVLRPDLARPGIAQASERYRAAATASSQVRLGLILLASLAGLCYALSRLSPGFDARVRVEKAIRAFLFVSSTVAVMTTLGIVFSLLFETFRFFQFVNVSEFLFGTKWSPQMAIRADQVASSGAFGALPLLAGTALIAFIAMCVAAPVGLLTAFYLCEYAGRRVRTLAKPTLEILAGIPTVVYGLLAALTVAPYIRDLGVSLGLSVSSESALAAGVVMGIMIIPFVSSLSDDVIIAVPQTLRDGSYALGATKSETIKRVVFPAALPGIIGALLLGISRAIGETMIVVMAAGLAANLTLNPLENVTTVTVQIVTILVGDQEFDRAKTLSAFALGLVLFFTTLVLNVIALQFVKRYREKYD